MREIEFRGYDPDTERWYYGSFVRLERVSTYAMSHTPEEDNRKHEENDYDNYIFFTQMNDWGLPTQKLRATVDIKSVGQFTGLYDKHNKKIYEGDIIKAEECVLADGHESTTPHIETKRDENFKYTGANPGLRIWGHKLISVNDRFGNHSDDYTDYYGYSSPHELTSGEVIGNIYENPELLQAKQ